jgi:hypothetical protein
VAYKMVAERDDQKVIKERASALIVLANARVWESEGWQVMITDAEGKDFDPSGFEKLLGPGYNWSPQEPLSSLQHQAMSLVPQTEEIPVEEIPAEETAQAAAPEAEPETLETERLQAEAFDEFASIEETGDDEAFARLEETDEYADFEPFEEIEEREDELEPHH